MHRFFLCVALLVGWTEGSCPDSNYYGPCLCLIDTNGFTSLDCSEVTDASELVDVFTTIDETYLASVDIKDSPSLMSLPDDLFGDVAVGALRISNTGMSEMQAGLVGDPAAQALTSLYLRRNDNMDVFKGESIVNLADLINFDATFNSFTTLQTPLPYNPVGSIYFSNNNINHIADSFFLSAISLSLVDLSFNNLTTSDLTDRTLEFADNGFKLHIGLGFNRISEGVPTAALRGTIPCELILTGNGITTFGSDMFSTLLYNMFFKYGLEEGCYVAMDYNPLICDCSILWFVESDVKSMVTGATCSDGISVNNLTIEDFQGC